MLDLTRRDFLTGLGAAGTAVFAGRLARAAAEPARIKRGTDLVKLGRTGIRPTLLGIGTGTHGGREQLALNQDGFTRLVRHALDRGVRYIDTADMYSMHIFVRLALAGVPRDKYFIQTKTMAKNAEVAKADLERFRRELKIDVIDSLLMHCMTKGTWPTDMRPVMDVLDEAKAKGRVRAVGISCHGWDPLVASADSDWPDVQLARINPSGTLMDNPPDLVAPVLRKMHDRGRGVIGMKIYGETGLASRAQRLQSLQYVLDLGAVDAFTIGFTSPEQLDETLDLIETAAVPA